MKRWTFTRTFTQADFDAFAEISGDDNPIHVDAAFAATTRWGRTLAHGMMLYAVISGFLQQAIPGGKQRSQQLKFPGPTFTGEEMTFVLEVIEEGPGRATVSARVTRPNGDAACESATVVSP